MKKILLILFVFICWKYVFSQSLLDSTITVVPGYYTIKECIDLLQKNNVSIAYSSSRIPSKKIYLEQDFSIKSLLDTLKSKKILDYSVKLNQIIITATKPQFTTIYGRLTDLETGEYIIGATVQSLQISGGSMTNGYGHFSLRLPNQNHTLVLSHVGYLSKKISISQDQVGFLSIEMKPKVIYLEEIEVTNKKNEYPTISLLQNSYRLPLLFSQHQIPYFLGEEDVFQMLLLQPGIKTIGEDASGIHVRGGNIDQNLILLDEAIIYNPNHFFGLISVFNPESVNDVQYFKGYIPASYGGRTSSVIEVKKKEGNKKRLSYSGGIGLLSARGLIEGPIKKDKISFLVSARQSILNIPFSNFTNSSIRRNTMQFQDLNFKINAKYNKNNTFYLSGYYGNDQNRVGLNSIRNWGNRVINFRWNHLFSSKLFGNLSSFYSRYNYRITNQEEPGAFIGESEIADYSLKYDFIYSPRSNSEINFGASTIFHELSPGSRTPFDKPEETNSLILDKEHSFESAIYVSHTLDHRFITASYGLRVSSLHNIGASTVYQYRGGLPKADSTILDTLFFEKNELTNSYYQIEPRINLTLKTSPTTFINSSYSKTTQYLHLLSNSITPSPSDIWKLSDNHLPPSINENYNLRFTKIFKNNFEVSTEIYYRQFRNNIKFKNGANLVFNQNIETELFFNKGRSYGFEFFIQKKLPKFHAWLSYSLSRVESLINQSGKTSYVVENYDKPHDLSVSWSLKLGSRWSLSGNFIYATGIPILLPTNKYIFENTLVPYFENRNNTRLPNYHRLDLSLKFLRKKYNKAGVKRKNADYWTLTIYNVYARKNVYSYYFRESINNPETIDILEYSIFDTIIPSITYNFKI